MQQQEFKKYVRSLVSTGILTTLDTKKDGRNMKRITISDIPASILQERIENQLNSI